VIQTAPCTITYAVKSPLSTAFITLEAATVRQLSLSDDENKVLQLEDWISKGYFHLSFYEVSASAGTGLLAEVEEQPKTISFEPNWLRSEVGVCPTNGIYIMRYDNNFLVKRLQMLPGGIIRVKSDNSMYDPWEITKSQLDGEELALIRSWFGLDKKYYLWGVKV